MGNLTRYRLQKQRGGPLTQIQRKGRIPLIDVGTIKLIKRGQIAIYSGIESFTEEGVIFTDGRQGKFEAVILATGYRPRVNTLLEGGSSVYDENGTPLTSGQETPIPGLYFCGYYVSPTGMLREIAIEARHIQAAVRAMTLRCRARV
jgi:indole-3-pyruvate monooxygenase